MSLPQASSNIATETGVTRLRMYIGGQWRDGTDERAVFDPYRRERVALSPEYGGIKASGIGREGPRYAMRDMAEERLILFNL